MSRSEPTLADWVHASRLRTLPLALSTIITGAALVIDHHPENFSLPIFILTIWTTILLQILSNWANDFGDFTHGTDDETRLGPMRSMQSGRISVLQMRSAIVILAITCLVSGLVLLYCSGILLSLSGFLFICFGLLAIWAAIRYTAGQNPYGYAGWGDLAVFIFFGLLGVLGSSYLHLKSIPLTLHVLPASSMGFLSAAVLNLNNMRDAKDDRHKGKTTMAVRLGAYTSKIYHACLISFGLISMIIYSILSYESPLDFLYLVISPVLLLHVIQVFKVETSRDLDPELKKVALSTFFMSVLLFIAQIL
ncbi:MAG: 1,4-dihydroxy-2-naphthoate octaprenyltransferase [Flavobacteriales bacterium]|nr:1,4-dihydroxy-2-naphthoate octaprenyltransferase [Flavobacteriales bacterium]